MKKQAFSIIFILLVFITSPCFAAGDPINGKEISQQCVACHGVDGNSPTPNFPRLAGQHEDYLYYSLQSYKNGERKNPIMVGIVAALSDEDMRNVSAYLSMQNGLKSINADNEFKKSKK